MIYLWNFGENQSTGSRDIMHTRNTHQHQHQPIPSSLVRVVAVGKNIANINKAQALVQIQWVCYMEARLYSLTL